MLELVSLPAVIEKEEEEEAEEDDDEASNSARNALPHTGPVSETDGMLEKLLPAAAAAPLKAAVLFPVLSHS